MNNPESGRWPVLFPIRGLISGFTTQSIPYSHRTTTHFIIHKLHLLMLMIDSHDCLIQKRSQQITRLLHSKASTATPRPSVRTRSRHPKAGRSHGNQRDILTTLDPIRHHWRLLVRRYRYLNRTNLRESGVRAYSWRLFCFERDYCT